MRLLGDLPANLLTPAIAASFIQKHFEQNQDVEVKVIDQDKAKEMGMNLFYSVAQGSADEGKFVTLKYLNNPKKDVYDVGLVGKGVTFDSGGISIKPSSNMHLMKMDMMGAATLFGAFALAVQFKLLLNLTLTLPFVVNMPGGRATKPGDVYVGLGGKSVEINNTDAEGRLIGPFPLLPPHPWGKKIGLLKFWEEYLIRNI